MEKCTAEFFITIALYDSSTRMRCLIRDVLDLRAASWTEYRAHRVDQPSTLAVRPDEPEPVETFVDFRLMNELPDCYHAVSMVESREEKLERVKSLMFEYSEVRMKIVIVASNASLPLLKTFFSELDCSTREFADAPRDGEELEQCVIWFNADSATSWPNVLLVSWEAARCDFAKKLCHIHVLLTFDLNPWFNNFLHQFVRWIRPDTHAITLFQEKYDLKRSCQLVTLLEYTGQQVPAALNTLAEKLPKKAMATKWKRYKAAHSVPRVDINALKGLLMNNEPCFADSRDSYRESRTGSWENVQCDDSEVVMDARNTEDDAYHPFVGYWENNEGSSWENYKERLLRYSSVSECEMIPTDLEPNAEPTGEDESLKPETARIGSEERTVIALAGANRVKEVQPRPVSLQEEFLENPQCANWTEWNNNDPMVYCGDYGSWSTGG